MDDPTVAGPHPARAARASTSSASPRASRTRRAPGLERAARAPGGAPSEAAAADGLVRPLAPARRRRRWPPSSPDDRLVVFVGKLIASKGVELLLAAWPLVLAREPRARLLIVGFGAFRAALEGLARDLDARRPRGGARAARRARRRAAAPGGVPRRARGRRTPTARRPRGMTDRIAWAGRLDHAELADVLPAAEAMAVPSTFPEAFGMVAAEAAACGALPVVAAHSGPRRGGPHARPPPRPEPRATVADLRGRARAPCASWPATSPPGWRRPPDLRAATREAIVAATREHYSWDGVARTVIAAARGELDGLPRPAPRHPSPAVRIPRLMRGGVRKPLVARRRSSRRPPASAAASWPTPGTNVVNGKEQFVAKCGVLPRARARRHDRRRRARTSTRRSSAPARTASARARSRASCTARSSTRRSARSTTRRPARRCR